MQTSAYDPVDIRIIAMRPWLTLDDHLSGLDLVSLSVGPAGDLYALAVTAPAFCHEGDIYNAPRFIFWSEQPHDYCVLRYDGARSLRYVLPEQHWNFHNVQPLASDELLLVMARARHFDDGAIDRNAKVFAYNGVLKRDFLLGDGIKDVQMTNDGRIWACYFDEGIFGNFGWKRPIGACGFVQWNSVGERLYEFTPPVGYRYAADGKALNVVSDTEMWCCYYQDFPLVRLRNEQIDAVWQSPVQGSTGFAIWQDYVLFRGGYRGNHEFLLFQFDNDRAMHHCLTFRIADERGNALHIDRITARGSQIFALVDRCIYRLAVPEIVAVR